MDHGSRFAADTQAFAELEAVLARSLAAGALVAAAKAVQSATRNSVFVSKITRAQRTLLTYSHADQLRVIGAFIASFGVTAAILMAMIPVASASALPWGVWLGVAAGGAALIAAADSFATAWAYRRRRGANQKKKL